MSMSRPAGGGSGAALFTVHLFVPGMLWLLAVHAIWHAAFWWYPPYSSQVACCKGLGAAWCKQTDLPHDDD